MPIFVKLANDNIVFQLYIVLQFVLVDKLKTIVALSNNPRKILQCAQGFARIDILYVSVGLNSNLSYVVAFAFCSTASVVQFPIQWC